MLERARERWEQLSSPERDSLRRRFEEFMKLPEEAREALSEHARELEKEKRRILDELSAEEREQLAALPPPERERILDALVLDRARESGRRIREKLPQELRQELESAPPERRLDLLASFLDEGRERHARKALGFLGRRLDLPQEEVESLRALEGEKLLQAVGRLHRRHIVERGRPDWLPEEEWAALQLLEDREFLQAWHRKSPCPPGPGGEHGPRFRGPDEHGPGSFRGFRGRGDGRGFGPHRGPNGHSETDGPARERPSDERSPLDRLPSLLHPSFRDHIELAELPPPVRDMRMRERVRQRVVDFLAEHGLETPERLEALRSMEEPRFREAVWDLILALREAERGALQAPERPGSAGN